MLAHRSIKILPAFSTSKQFSNYQQLFSNPTQHSQASGIGPKGSLGGGENPTFSSFLSGQFCVAIVLSLSIRRLPQTADLDSGVDQTACPLCDLGQIMTL